MLFKITAYLPFAQITPLQKPLSLFFCIFILFSCTQEVRNDKTIVFSITSPKPGWMYYENTKIIMAVNLNTDNIKWSSDTVGVLGKGNHLALFLPQGLHCIKADIDGYTRELSVYVSPSADGMHTILVNYAPMEIKMKNGNCFSFAYTHDGIVNNFRMSQVPSMLTSPVSHNLLQTSHLSKSSETPSRDIRLPMPVVGKPVNQIRQRSIIRNSNTISNSYNLGDKRTFFVINTGDQSGTPHNANAELVHQSNSLSVWVSDTASLSGDVLEKCVEVVETLIIPRVQTLWGKTSDIDNDGRITLLFSPTLNDEGVLGFFNPADFFIRNEDVTSNVYNPSSNEMDIIYVALPEIDPKSAYTPASINATIAHELTHAATFTIKTWNRINSGNINASREELFLDEGWSHLTESLCGLGISGGNINFVKRFFENTSAFSLCGQDDSAGMRGAITLFLSWLFWEAGGMSWDISDPVKLNCQGGISFLRRMVESPHTGWESIGIAYGKHISQLFNEFLYEMHDYRMTNNTYNYKTDPYTNEVVDFFVNMGETIGLGFPKTLSIYTGTSLLPWTFKFLDPFSLHNETLLTLNAGNISGTTFYSYTTR